MFPLAMAGALVLLLSSLSLQSLLLHTRGVQAAERRSLLAADHLASAAHQVAGALQGRYACLRSLPSTLWSDEVLATVCPPDLDPSLLQIWQIAGQTVRMRSWEPLNGGGTFELQLADQGLRRRFRLSASGVREQG